jgi:hypothetical protein
MSEQEVAFSKTEKATRIRQGWEQAVETITPSHTVAKAPMFGFNLRINVSKALQATFETAFLALETLRAAHTTFDPVAWIGVGQETLAAVQTVTASLVQKMRPIDYITYIMLSRSPDGLSELSLKQSVEAFVKDPGLFAFAWHLGMTEAKAKQASEVIQGNNWFQTTLSKLREHNMIQEQDGLIKFRTRNLVLSEIEE